MQSKKKKKKRNLKNSPEELKSWAKYSGLAFQMGFIIAIGVWGGKKLEKVFDTDNSIISAIVILIAVCAAIYLAIKDFILPKDN